MSEETFTVDELLAVLIAARENETEAVPGTYTTEQLRILLGARRGNYVAELLRPHIASGRVECVRVPFTRIDGVRTTVPAYRLVTDMGSQDGNDGVGKSGAGTSV